jgi:signal peptidase I
MHWTKDRGLVVTAILGALLVIGAIVAIVAISKDRPVPSVGPSMRPTLTGPEDLVLDYDAYEDVEPAVGDIVIVQAPEGVKDGCAVPPGRGPCGTPRPETGFSDIRLVKRIVAGPGQSVAFTPDGHTILDGEPVDEPFIRSCPRPFCGLPDAIVVPDGHFFVVGDNRPASYDSRRIGPVPFAAIDGRVVLED